MKRGICDMKSSQFKPRQLFRCMHCGRFVGNGNLGGYMSDRVSKRGLACYCAGCVEKMDGVK